MTIYYSEFDIQAALIEYIEYQYPDVYFYSDLNGVRLTPGLAKKVKELQMKERKWLDLFMPEPRRGYAGLFVELKRSTSEYLTKKGKLRTSKRIQAQYQTILAMRERNFYADFAGGWDEAKELVDWYLTGDF